jgi:hypothetical protein
MPCLIGCFALFMPRLALILVWLFSDYLDAAYQTKIWPLLGFLFMPLTTLAYAWAKHYGNGSVEGIGLVVVVLAVLIDLGLLGTSESSRRSMRRRPRI